MSREQIAVDRYQELEEQEIAQHRRVAGLNEDLREKRALIRKNDKVVQSLEGRKVSLQMPSGETQRVNVSRGGVTVSADGKIKIQRFEHGEVDVCRDIILAARALAELRAEEAKLLEEIQRQEERLKDMRTFRGACARVLRDENIHVQG